MRSRCYHCFFSTLVHVLALVEMSHSWISLQQQPRPRRTTTTPTRLARLFSASPSLFDVSIWRDDHWELDDDAPVDFIQPPHIQETWNWCRHFVVQYGLCPWARSSTETKHAIHFYVVVQDAFDALEDAVELAALEFHHAKKDPHTAISFVLLLDRSKDDRSSFDASFEEFYSRFLNLEDDFLEHDNPILRNEITLAPFHPEWMFADDDNPVLSVEKQSPYPTISIVSARAIEQAGPAVTEQIGRNNAQMLSSRSVEEWQSIYQAAIAPSH